MCQDPSISQPLGIGLNLKAIVRGFPGWCGFYMEKENTMEVIRPINRFRAIRAPDRQAPSVRLMNMA
jgi:hypothetical protein